MFCQKLLTCIWQVAAAAVSKHARTHASKQQPGVPTSPPFPKIIMSYAACRRHTSLRRRLGGGKLNQACSFAFLIFPCSETTFLSAFFPSISSSLPSDERKITLGRI